MQGVCWLSCCHLDKCGAVGAGQQPEMGGQSNPRTVLTILGLSLCLLLLLHPAPSSCHPALSPHTSQEINNNEEILVGYNFFNPSSLNLRFCTGEAEEVHWFTIQQPFKSGLLPNPDTSNQLYRTPSHSTGSKEGRKIVSLCRKPRLENICSTFKLNKT